MGEDKIGPPYLPLFFFGYDYNVALTLNNRYI
ncbi:MAG: hypothetical protein JWM44_3564 [Bacilli bacterium]|nr:hypothetical protein [Bacilli bacterium]